MFKSDDKCWQIEYNSTNDYECIDKVVITSLLAVCRIDAGCQVSNLTVSRLRNIFDTFLLPFLHKTGVALQFVYLNAP